MPLPVTFAQLPQGDNAASLLDTQFNAVAGFTTIPCAATGQNVLQLQPFADAPVVTTMSDLAPVFIFAAQQTSTGNVTASVSGLGEFPIYHAGGALVTLGDLIAGSVYKMCFLSSLQGGAGGFQLL